MEVAALSHVYCLSRICRMLEMVGVCILMRNSSAPERIRWTTLDSGNLHSLDIRDVSCSGCQRMPLGEGPRDQLSSSYVSLPFGFLGVSSFARNVLTNRTGEPK